MLLGTYFLILQSFADKYSSGTRLQGLALPKKRFSAIIFSGSEARERRVTRPTHRSYFGVFSLEPSINYSDTGGPAINA